MLLLRRFANLRWKLAFSYVGVTLLTILVIETSFLLGVGWVGSWINNVWIKQSTLSQAEQLAQDLVEPLEKGSTDNVLQGLDQGVEFTIAIAPTDDADQKYQLENTQVVLDTRGRIIASSQPDYYLSGEYFTDTLVTQVLADGLNRSLLEEEIDSYVVVTPVTNTDGTPLGILYYRYPKINLEGWSLSSLGQPLLVTTAILLPCMIPLGLIFGFVTASSFIRRLRQLTQTSQALAAGDLSSRIQDASSDEIGQLANQFNAMAEQIQADTIQLQELARHNARLAEKNQWLAALEERHRLARELHDGVKQHLFGVNLSAAAALNLLDTDLETARARLLEAKEHSHQAQVEMYALLNELRPAGLDERGLVPALTDYLGTFERRHGIQVHWQMAESSKYELPPIHEQALFRVVQEAMTNVVRHAEATEVHVDLYLKDKTITLSIVDNGKGFDMARLQLKTTMGIQGMTERLAELGGTLAVEAAPGHGTRILANLPHTDSQKDNAHV